MWLGFVDPNMVGISAFDLPLSDGHTLRVMASLKTYLTSFGYTVNLNALVQHGDLGFDVTLLNQLSQSLYHPGVSVRMVRYPVWRRGRRGIFVSPRVVGWVQPSEQRFDATSREVGGALEVDAELQLLGPLGLKASVGAKSAGWLLGNPYLDRRAYGRIGLTATF